MLKLKVFVCANVNCEEKIRLRNEKSIWSTKSIKIQIAKEYANVKKYTNVKNDKNVKKSYSWQKAHKCEKVYDFKKAWVFKKPNKSK